MSYVNLCQSTSEEVVASDSDLWGPEPYDINFSLPIDTTSLENNLVKLTPFVPRVHANLFWERFVPAREDALKYIPWHLPTLSDFLILLEFTIRRDPQYLLFAVVDKKRISDTPGLGGAVAGIIGLLRTTPEQLSSELGALIVLPEFQRTYVTSNAVGLLLRYCLDTPMANMPGLGLRRVQWSAFVGNEASMKAALRFGFKPEMERRWARLLVDEKGLPPRKGDPFPRNAGTHSLLLSLCWDDWESGGRQNTLELMKPRTPIVMDDSVSVGTAPPSTSIRFFNRYKRIVAPSPTNIYGPDPYDINFLFPLHLESLENDRIRLTPFIPRIHAELYWKKFLPRREEVLRYVPWQLPSIDNLLSTIELGIRSNPTWILFAIIDKTRESEQDFGGALAGMIGFIRTEPSSLTTEIGCVFTFRDFQRTHVTSNAVGLLMHYALELPTAHPCPGLGFRRVVWGTRAENVASVRTAERMGFKPEGMTRWTRLVTADKEGLPSRQDDPFPECPGWHAVHFALCWDDWENGGREHVRKQMDRR
jgi:RimJ/RimL family protein N-acetyltransferase